MKIRRSVVRQAPKALIILACAGVARADPPVPTGIPANFFNITDFGASPSNSAAANATDIDNAVVACEGAGGGVVVIPSGTFQSQPITINGGNLDFEVNGTLQAAPESTYSDASTNFITWSNGTNSEVSGSGTIDGQGSTWWTAGTGGAPLATRPVIFHISNAQTMLITGVTMINSPKMFVTFAGSKTNNITVTGIDISAPATSPNTDGIDVNGSNFLIESSTISNGDDNIAFSAFPGNSIVNNVTVTNMTFGTGHGVSVGSEIGLGVNNVTVTNSTFNGTTNGIRLKSGRGNGGVAQNLNYNNITMTNVKNPIYISSWYNSTAGGFNFPSTPQSAPTADFNNTTTPVWQNVTISNLTSTNSAAGSIAGLIYGLPESLVSGVTLNNVNISASLGMSVDYAGTNANPILFEGNWSIDPLSGPQFGTFSNPNSSNPGSLSTGIFDSVLELPEPGSFSLMGVAGFAFLKRRRRIPPVRASALA